MAESNETPAAPESAWRLLAQFVLPGEAGSATRAASLTMEAIRELKLPEGQLQLIRDAVADAARTIREGGGPNQPALPISITLLAAGGNADVVAPSDPAPQPVEAPERRGWGCFIIKRLVDDTPVADVGAHHKLELFLYPEGQSRDDEAS